MTIRALLVAVIAFTPAAAKAQPTQLATDTATVTFDVNGLKVILRRNTANDVVVANMYLLGGTQQLTPATQGIETLLLNASERGTKRFPGAAARQIPARLGSYFTISGSEDWTLFGLRSVRSTFDSTFAVFADRIAAPTLDSSEVELVRARMTTAERLGANDPDDVVQHLADSLTFVGHPYGFDPNGTESSLYSITLGQLRGYQATQMVTSRMLLVVVGNVERARVEQLVQRTLGQLPRGNYTWAPPHLPPHLGKAAVVRNAPLPTNYLLGFYVGPTARDPDYAALRVATAVLSGRFFTEIRSRRNLSYEVDAPFLERAISAGGVYVTTVSPDTTLQLMRAEINRLKTELIDPQGLDRLVQQFITEYFLKNETNGDQATFLARAQIYQGDYRMAQRFVADLRRVTPEDVQRVARAYMHDFRFVYLGNASALNQELLSQF
ncbi:MAG TPA: pitrilysin family protein [Gemmatimonadaceae bacterium]|nr:pitrilysin family protein [Gemmatimonadaceae bacterium]